MNQKTQIPARVVTLLLGFAAKQKIATASEVYEAQDAAAAEVTTAQKPQKK